MSKISKINHIAIATHNLEESLNFFSKLGLYAYHQEEMLDRGIKVAFISIGEVNIELIASLHEKGEIANFLNKKGPGIHHIAFECTDLANELDQLANKEINLINRQPKPGAHNTNVAFIHPKSTGGVLVELVEKADDKSSQ